MDPIQNSPRGIITMPSRLAVPRVIGVLSAGTGSFEGKLSLQETTVFDLLSWLQPKNKISNMKTEVCIFLISVALCVTSVALCVTNKFFLLSGI
jgi:hypothetical protein